MVLKIIDKLCNILYNVLLYKVSLYMIIFTILGNYAPIETILVFSSIWILLSIKENTKFFKKLNLSSDDSMVEGNDCYPSSPLNAPKNSEKKYFFT